MIKFKQGSKAYGFKTIRYLGEKLSDNIIKGTHSMDQGDVVCLMPNRNAIWFANHIIWWITTI